MFIPRLAHNDTTAEPGGIKKIKLFGYMIGTAAFFAVTLLISFFLLIMTINAIKVPANMASNILMLGLVPPSVATFLLFTKIFGRIL